jgi:hypothetical protein
MRVLYNAFGDAPFDNRLQSGQYKYFETELVGIPLDGGSPVDLANIFWKDNYNFGIPYLEGGAEITSQSYQEFPIDADTGTGGADILNISYPSLQTAVPEPPTILLFLSASIVLLWLSRRNSLGSQPLKY